MIFAVQINIVLNYYLQTIILVAYIPFSICLNLKMILNKFKL